MQVFVISLSDSKRRSFIKQQLDDLGIEFEFFDAVYGKALTNEERDRYCDHEAIKANPQWLNDGAIGCSLSHYFVYNQILERGLDRALVIEDDMLLHQDFKHVFDALSVRDLKEEVVMLYYRAFNKIRFCKPKSELIGKFSINEVYSLNEIPMTTGCYYITNAAAKKIAEIILPIRFAADTWKAIILQSDFSALKVVYPRPIEDAGFKSEIDYHGSYSSGFTQKVKSILDRLNFPLIEFLAKLRRKSFESKMSQFELINEPSLVSLQKAEHKQKA